MSYTINIHHEGHYAEREERGRGRRRHHRHGRHPQHGRGRGGRAGRGDLRNTILLLLDQEPMHGYQIISTIGERTDEHWTPSPGAIYPRLSMLEDEGLISIAVTEGRKLATLTEEGRALVDANRDAWGGILDAYRNPTGPDVGHHERRRAMRSLREAVKAAPENKQEEVLGILGRAARDIEAL